FLLVDQLSISSALSILEKNFSDPQGAESLLELNSCCYGNLFTVNPPYNETPYNEKPYRTNSIIRTDFD
ncbi:hypothetical protein BpHYR1_005212, partial [Brachionus plicatilis]